VRILIPIVIILLGMLAGAAVCTLFKETRTGFKLSVVAGGVGAFAGLLIRDAMDISYAGPLAGALLAAITGACLFAAITNLFFGQTGKD